ncbi:MAG: HAD-IC family P-type ATPase [Oscillospiraceae bacterium]|nr:HAD-IC family P-type ATPase [Oscillospiraceae bacterium]
MRLKNGYANDNPEPPERTTGQIIADNIFTYFNLIFATLAVLIAVTGHYKELTFLPVVFANIIIGVVQELRSRAKLRTLTLITTPKAAVIRDGSQLQIPCEYTVLDDIAVFASGGQIYADAIVVGGECRVNEALVTGESDEITKTPGDTLLSGSFVVSGECRARLDKVGRESFVAKLTLEAKKSNKKMRSEMMYALTKLVKMIGVVIIPFGAIMLYQQLKVLKLPFADGMITTVAALIGMIPEGLYLLVSVALTVSVMRLAKRRVLVQEMRCIETLARVDVLCVDKTGTITEPEMNVREVIPLNTARFSEAHIAQIMADYLGGGSNENETTSALSKFFTGDAKLRVTRRLAFSSSTKYAGAELSDGTAYLVGAWDKLLTRDAAGGVPYGMCEKHSSDGYRVLLLAQYSGDISTADRSLTTNPEPIALLLLTNKIREAAPATFKYFAEQGVSVRVISGDNPQTVARIAADAGIEGAERCIDASTLKTERQIRRAAADYIVFGRVTPDLKRRLIRALKAEGHTVAMTGDGVNDVLALKDADCGIAMASGSDVACHVAQLVLLDSDFSAMTSVVAEGRRVINNIERSASLFLVKNIFSFLLTAIALLFTLSYPMTPSQLTLFNVMFIGIPSFFLALEPNRARVRGRFLANVLINSLPAGLTDVAVVISVMLLGTRFGITPDEQSTMATIVIAFVGFMMLIKVARPMNLFRRALVSTMVAGFALGALVFSDMFNISALGGKAILMTSITCAASIPVMLVFAWFARRARTLLRSKVATRRRPRRVKV